MVALFDEEDPRESLEAYLKAYNTLYDDVKNESLKRFIKKTLSPLQNKSVLEIGAGGGIWTRFWLDEGASSIACDLRLSILRGNRTWNPEAKFLVADATTMKLKKKFDIVFVKDVVEHIPDENIFLQNMVDHLNDNGRLFITTQNALSLNYFIEGGYYFLHGITGWCGWDATHLRFYNFRQLSRKLRLVGLIPIKWWGTYYFPYRFLSRRLSQKLIEWKGFHLVELLNLNDKFPFNFTGWNIGVVSAKGACK